MSHFEALLPSSGQSYLDGSWRPAISGKTYQVFNPWNREQIALVPKMGQDDVHVAVRAAHQAWPAWRDRLAADRALILMRWHDLILEHRAELAELMVVEQGKPLAEARGEISYGASFIKWFAEEATRANGAILPSFGHGRQLMVTKQPVGVVGAITPWNFPNAMITRKCAPALAAGCTIVIKPAEDTPLSALALVRLAEQAGFPPGVINLITTDREGAAEVGETLCLHPIVRKVGFTGSTEVGKRVMAHAASTVKRVSLELGGNAPFIIFDDARQDLAIKGLFMSKFRNAGQTCICANRIFVHRSRLAAFSELICARLKSFKLGFGMDKGVNMGPLINKRAIQRAQLLVKRAIEEGAQVLAGGRTLNQNLEDDEAGMFFEPTVLTEVSQEMEIAQSELFAPIVTLIPFDEESEVVEMANRTPYGLAAYFFTEDYRRIWRVSSALEYGMVAVNDGALSNRIAPFGGVKESGIGREGSSWGLDEFLEMKYIMLGGLEASGN